ncbi:hypothetical protein L2E82_09037 [Cichorium intybus]|uniref:Uncharacterized protein n=1 Tax=Cichorium intybus TaxID=13427 RepID=A0ACB9G9A5_CICIN|nr:hypothetical protein L2E82_09037 [Cichorium intybus]
MFKCFCVYTLGISQDKNLTVPFPLPSSHRLPFIPYFSMVLALQIRISEDFKSLITYLVLNRDEIRNIIMVMGHTKGYLWSHKIAHGLLLLQSPTHEMNHLVHLRHAQYPTHNPREPTTTAIPRRPLCIQSPYRLRSGHNHYHSRSHTVLCHIHHKQALMDHVSDPSNYQTCDMEVRAT